MDILHSNWDEDLHFFLGFLGMDAGGDFNPLPDVCLSQQLEPLVQCGLVSADGLTELLGDPPAFLLKLALAIRTLG